MLIAYKLGYLKQALSNEVATRAELGAHQFLDYDLALLKLLNTAGTWNDNKYTLNGVEITVNADKSLTISTNSSGATGLVDFVVNNRIYLEPGSYSLSLDVELFDAYTYTRVLGWNGSAWAELVNRPNNFTASETYQYYWFSVRLLAGATFNPSKIYKPLIKLTSDLSKEFTSYSMTNQQLAEKLKANSIVSGANIFTSVPSGVTLGNYSTLVLAGYLGIIRLQLAITDSIAAWAPIINVKESYRPSVSANYFVDLENRSYTVFLNNNGDIVTNRSLSNGDNVLIYGIYPIK